MVGACHHHHPTLKKTTMPFPPDFPRNSGESKQTGSESSFRLAGVSAPPKIPRIQWNVPRSVPRPPNLTTPAAHSELHCEPRKEKLADVRCESVRSVTHFFFRDGGDSRSIDHDHLSPDFNLNTSHPKKPTPNRQPYKPSAEPPQDAEKRVPPSRPLTGVIATPSSTVSPLPPGESRTKKSPRAAARTPVPFGTPGLSDPPECQEPAIDLVHRQSRSSLVSNKKANGRPFVDQRGGNVAASLVSHC